MLRKLALLSLIAALVALPASGALAAVMAVATEIANPPTTPFANPDAGLGAPWRSFQLSLVATEGELVGAVDVTIDGPLHQRWGPDSDFNGEGDPTPNGPPGGAANMRGDSHLTAPAGSPFGLGPSETNSKSGSPLTSTPATQEYGLGGLRGAWAILAPAATTNLAYIVVPGDMMPEIDITVLSANPTGDPFPMFDEVAFGFGDGGGGVAPVAVDASLGERIRGAIISHMFTTSAGDDPITWSDLQVSGPGAPANAPTLTADGSFSWNSHNSPFGSYTFSATATNTTGSDTGMLTVDIVIPEPATLTLVGLAMVGFVGLMRRRS